MTTRVAIVASCSADTEVLVSLFQNSEAEPTETVLQSGESTEHYISGDQEVSVYERAKG